MPDTGNVVIAAPKRKHRSPSREIWVQRQRAEAPRTIPFWIVRGMKPPGVEKHGYFHRYATRALAEAEAQRLAEKFIGRQFVVLEAVASFKIDGGLAL
jgi:hypothetical protein